MSNKYLSQLWIVVSLPRTLCDSETGGLLHSSTLQLFQELFDSREIKLNNQSLCVYISRAWSHIIIQPKCQRFPRLQPTISHYFPTGLLKKTVAFQNILPTCNASLRTPVFTRDEIFQTKMMNTSEIFRLQLGNWTINPIQFWVCKIAFMEFET